MNSKRKFIVEKEDEGTRLDLFLSNHNDDTTRAFVKKTIDDNKVYVNGEIQYRANYKVKTGDKVEAVFEQKEQNNVIAEDIELDIIYEDENLVAINKPSGMVVHPATGNFTGTLVNALLFRYKDIKLVGERIRSGLIHRLDKETSGVILAAKTNKGLWYFTKLFANREVKKYYLAVCTGKIGNVFKNSPKLSVQNFIGRNPKNRQKMTVLKEGGRFAHTDFEIIASVGSTHLIQADLETGRTHQVRVHLASLGLPVLGDDKYGGGIYKRLMLHAWKLKLININGKNLNLVANIPVEFVELFNGIDKIVES